MWTLREMESADIFEDPIDDDLSNQPLNDPDD